MYVFRLNNNNRIYLEEKKSILNRQARTARTAQTAPKIYFKYHNTNVDLKTYTKINNYIKQAETNNNGFIEYSNPSGKLISSDIIVNANLYGDTPKILSATGFSHLVSFHSTSDLYDGQQFFLGNYNTNLDINSFPLRNITSSQDIRVLSPVTRNLQPGMDAMPICFTFPILPSSVDINQFAITLNIGFVVKPYDFTFAPNSKYNEKQCIILNGYWTNRLVDENNSYTMNSIYPVSVEIVESFGKKLYAIGPKGLYNMTGKTVTFTDGYVSPIFLNACVLTKYTMPNIYNHLGDIGSGVNAIENQNSPNILYGNDAEYRFRIFTAFGYSPDGISPMLPDQYEKYWYLQYVDPSTSVVTNLYKQQYKYTFGSYSVTIVGLADLGFKSTTGYNSDTYSEDHDNQIDIVVKGDETVIKNIKKLIIPSGGSNPDTGVSYISFMCPGGPGPTPIPGIKYTLPSEYQELDIINNLNNPKTVTWIGNLKKF